MSPPLSQAQEDPLHELYFEKGIRLGRDKLYQAAVAADHAGHLSRRQVQAWLFNQEPYQLDYPTRASRTIRPFTAGAPLDVVHMDLIDFTNKPPLHPGLHRCTCGPYP